MEEQIGYREFLRQVVTLCLSKGKKHLPLFKVDNPSNRRRNEEKGWRKYLRDVTDHDDMATIMRNLKDAGLAEDIGFGKDIVFLSPMLAGIGENNEQRREYVRRIFGKPYSPSEEVQEFYCEYACNMKGKEGPHTKMVKITKEGLEGLF